MTGIGRNEKKNDRDAGGRKEVRQLVVFVMLLQVADTIVGALCFCA